jgi:hypothetical protein
MQYKVTESADNLILLRLYTITANELKTHLYIVAADGMEGRETGSAGQKLNLPYQSIC